MAFNASIDYAAEIKKRKAANPNADVSDLEKARAEKIAAASNDQLIKYGFKTTDGGILDTYTNQIVRPTQQQPQIVQQPQQPIVDIASKINDLAKVREDAAIAGFAAAKNNKLSQLSQEESGIKPMYYNKRNAVAASNQLGRRTLAEELARRGETASGVADQAAISANASLQGQTGALRQQEAADIADIGRRRTDVNNAYETDVAGARAGIQTAALEQTINQMNQDRAFNRNAFESDRSYNYQTGRDTIADQRYNKEYADNRADIEWERKWQTSQNNPAYRMQLLQEQMAQFELENAKNPNSLENQQKKAQIAATWQNLQEGKISMDRAKWEFANLKEGKNADGSARTPNTSGQSFTTFSIDDWGKVLDNEFIPKYDSYGDLIPGKEGVTGQVEREKRILGLGLDEAMTRALYQRYGIPLPK